MKDKDKLNVNQEMFVQNLIKGMSQREAYKKAYKAKYKDEAIDTKASVLFSLDKVQKRYRELLEKIEDEAIMSARKRMKWLTDVVQGDIKEKTAIIRTDSEGNSELVEQEFPSKLDTKLKAIDILNKMTGEYKTILDGTIEVKKKLEDLI